MGVLQVCDVELDELRKMLLGRDGLKGGERKSGAVGSQRVLNGNEVGDNERMVCVTSGKSLVGSAKGGERKSGAVGSQRVLNGNEGGDNERMVCVTSGKSLVGSAIVHRLLSQGYSVRITVRTQEDVEKVKEMFQTTGRDVMSAVVGDSMNIDTLCQAFEGCFGVFHTSGFIDHSGVSGYTKYMADNEARVAKLVVEACARTESVRKCVFTSSLLACVWQQRYPDCPELPIIVDERCWSDESLCRDKKLWYALGKTMAERAAWSVARAERQNLKLVTLCPALVAGQQNSIPYLKGAQEMLGQGLLATVCVDNVAEAHIKLYEEETACGRYICFDNQLIPETQEAEQLLRQFNKTATSDIDQSDNQLSNWKLSKLLSGRRRCSYTLIPTCTDTLY